MKSQNPEQGQRLSSARAFAALVQKQFALGPETDHEGTLQFVRSEVEFRSGNTWSLVFAVLICSVGLNVNSTAVIIGAMLISPLMGPIVGAGFGLASNDFGLLKRSLRNVLLAAVVAVVSSTLYFAISPLADVQSELLARTRPTLYDVLIAAFGGGAGVVAVSRKGNKGNVVPGVAIATALMPPLCTAGFGIAEGNLSFLLGALHLFFINALFICLATLTLARLMHFEPLMELDLRQRTRARIAITLITLGIALPSAYTAWVVILETRFQQAARRFVTENFNFPDRAIVNVDARYSRDTTTITATVLGPPFSKDAVGLLEQRLPLYGLNRTRLVLKQPVAEQASIEQLGQMVRQGVLEDLYARGEQGLRDRDRRIRELEEEIVRLRTTAVPLGEITRELAALYPSLVSLGVGRQVEASDTINGPQSTVVVASWRRVPTANEQRRLREFLSRRLAVDSLRLVNVVAR